MQAVSPSPHTHSYVHWDDFFRLRTRQDEELNARLGSIDDSINGIRQELTEFKEETTTQFNEIRTELTEFKEETTTQFNEIRTELTEFKEETTTQFNEIRTELNEVKIASLRMAARFQNYTLRNPAMRITPVVAFNSFGEIVNPDPKHFPRNAKEFYAMRDTSNKRGANMLNYLVDFYDVQLHYEEPSQSNSEVNDNGSPETVDTVLVALEMLEGILGLNEDNFIKFKARAAAMARHSPQPAVKRPNPPSTSTDGGPRKLPSRPFRQISSEPNSEKDRTSETSLSQRRPQAFNDFRSLDEDDDPIESPTNEHTTPERR
jgi:hypothetical protein